MREILRRYKEFLQTFSSKLLPSTSYPVWFPISGIVGELVASKGASLDLSVIPLQKAKAPTAASRLAHCAVNGWTIMACKCGSGCHNDGASQFHTHGKHCL